MKIDDKAKQAFLEITDCEEYDLRRDEFRWKLSDDKEATDHLLKVIFYVSPEKRPEYEEGVHIDYFYCDARELDVELLKREAATKLALMREQGDVYSEPHKSKYLEAVRQY